jgi:hypothetical protein
MIMITGRIMMPKKATIKQRALDWHQRKEPADLGQRALDYFFGL